MQGMRVSYKLILNGVAKLMWDSPGEMRVFTTAFADLFRLHNELDTIVLYSMHKEGNIPC